MDITLGRAISDLRYNYPSMAIMYLRVTSAKMVYVSAVPFRKRWHLFYFIAKIDNPCDEFIKEKVENVLTKPSLFAKISMLNFFIKIFIRYIFFTREWGPLVGPRLDRFTIELTCDKKVKKFSSLRTGVCFYSAVSQEMALILF